MKSLRIAALAPRVNGQRVGGRSLPPQLLILLSSSSMQTGAAFAKYLFPQAGAGGTAFLRIGFAALALLLIWRPRLRSYTRATVLPMVLFGLALAAMNFTFYLAIQRIPLGIAVTIEFVGPLSVAVLGSRRLIDLLWVVLAATGIVLLTPLGVLGGKQPLDPQGITYALIAGVCWGLYIVLNARVGRTIAGGAGLAGAMTVGALALTPIGVLGAGRALLNPGLLLAGLGVAFLSSVLPYTLEMAVLRRTPPHVFGVLISAGPALATLSGFLILHETLSVRALLALVLVTIASVGTTVWRANAGRTSPDGLPSAIPPSPVP